MAPHPKSLLKTCLTFAEIERALDVGKVEMQRPWGDWVSVRRRASTVKQGHGGKALQVWMENQVEGSISTYGAQVGFPDVRIVP